MLLYVLYNLHLNCSHYNNNCALCQHAFVYIRYVAVPINKHILIVCAMQLLEDNQIIIINVASHEWKRTAVIKPKLPQQISAQVKCIATLAREYIESS